jgi:hypothetical protein
MESVLHPLRHPVSDVFPHHWKNHPFRVMNDHIKKDEIGGACRTNEKMNA